MFDPLTSSDVTAEAVIQLPQRRMLCIHPKSNPTFVHPLANKMPPGSVVILRDGTSTSTVTAVAKALTKGQYLTIDSSLKLAPADLIGVAIALGHEQTLNLSEFDPHHFPTDLVRKLWCMTNLILSTKADGKVFWIHPKSNPIGEEVNRCNGSAVSEATPFDPTEAGDNDPAETTMAVEKMASAAGTEEAKPYLLNTTPNPIQLICEEVHSCNGVTVSEATPFDPTEATNPTMIIPYSPGFPNQVGDNDSAQTTVAVETVIDTIAEIIIKELTRLKVLKTTEAEILSNALLQLIKAIANNESLDLTLFSCTNLLNACHDYFKAACDERMNVNRNILLLIETLDSISQRNNGPELQVAHPELATTLVLHMGRVLTGLPHHLVMADRIEDPIDPTATSASNDDPAAEKIETDPIPDKPISEEEKKKMKKRKKGMNIKKRKKRKLALQKKLNQ